MGKNQRVRFSYWVSYDELAAKRAKPVPPTVAA